MDRLRRLLSHRSGEDDGQTTIEWLGVAAVVAAIIALLLLSSPGLGDAIARQVECLISTVSGAGGCSGEGSAANPGEPDEACTVTSTDARATASARVLIIDAETGDAYIREEKSDGTIEVTFIEEGSFGISGKLGGGGKVDVNGVGGGGKAEATAGVSLDGYIGTTTIFDNPADADQFIQDRITDEAIEACLPVELPARGGAK